jgi:hypothetical protein
MRKGWLEFNPCHGVRRNKESPSKAYVSHGALTDAIDRANEDLQDLLAVAYLTGIRQTDLMRCCRQPFRVTGCGLSRARRGSRRSTRSRPRCGTSSPRLGTQGADAVRVPAGLPWSQWGLQSALRRLKMGFQFRQLRPKAQTDAQDRNVIGHIGQMR